MSNLSTLSVESAKVSKVSSNNSLVVQAKKNGLGPTPGSLMVEVRGISARVNQNFDSFPSSELKKAAHTFVGKPVFVNHNNDDPTKTRGIIAASEYRENGDDKFIQLLLKIDAKAYPRLAKAISAGELDSVSMGTNIEFSKCSACGNIAHEIEDFCNHVKYSKGRKIAVNGKKVLVHEVCAGLSFFEISLVFDPADETAIFSRVYTASKRVATQGLPFFVRRSH